MVISALARLRHRSAQLNAKLTSGTATELASARELLRLSLVELYEIGHWRQHPDEFRYYMRLFRGHICHDIIALPSMSGLGRTDQHSP